MLLFFEKIRRNYIYLKMTLTRNGWKKAKFLKKKKIFKHIGDNCYYHSNYLPAEPFLVEIGDNVVIAAGVRLITHSAQHIVFNHEEKTNKYRTMFGNIVIGNNVFIGADSKIMMNVKIGNNVVVAAGAVVTKDIEDGSVVAGVPARVIGTYESLKKKNELFSEDYKDCKSNRVIDMVNYIKESDDKQ